MSRATAGAKVMEEMHEAFTAIHGRGTLSLSSSKMSNSALEVAGRGYVLEAGSVTLEGTAAELRADTRGGGGVFGDIEGYAWAELRGWIRDRWYSGRNWWLLDRVTLMTEDRGKHRGERHTKGGRRWVRNAIYMPCVGAATLNNQVLKAFYQRLIANGKKPKVALIACMRKLIVILNTLIARRQKWDPRRYVLS